MIRDHTRIQVEPAVFVCAAGLLTLLLLGHRWIPDVLGLGVALDTATPWLVLPVPVLAVAALLRGRPIGAVATLVPLLVWAHLFASWWLPSRAETIPLANQLRVVSQNLYAGNASPTATAHALADLDADVIAVQELPGSDSAPVGRILDAVYPYREQRGTVALWSRYPTSDTTTVDVGIGWQRGLRTHITTPRGDLVVYAVHLPSVRPTDTATRDHGLTVLSRQLATDPAPHILVAGDFNTATTDRHWRDFAPGYRDTQLLAGSDPGFTWPAAFPIARLDHLLVRGLTVANADVHHLPGPDHRAVAATIAVPA